jgi:hypothetical protein
MTSARWLLVAAALLTAARADAQAAFAYADAPLAEVIADVEARSDWRFLYRDALVAGVRVSLRAATASLPAALAAALDDAGVRVDADPARRQILLLRGSAPPRAAPTAATLPPPPPTRAVRGRVLDAETGEGLPYATVSWLDDGRRRGAVADLDGAFSLSLPGSAPAPVLTASFVGYGPVSAAPRATEVAFRLTPVALAPAPVVIAASQLDARLDTAWTALLHPGRYAALGEGGGLRALEQLPSVTPGALFADGTVVRGSAADAFEVRLDGVPIYNPRHVFGLTDAFNADALRAVALHVGVAPARSASPPGGTVEYVTSAGSLRGPRVRAGLSSLAARAAVDGPLRPGRTSALAAGRVSTLGALPWPGAETLVAQGLGAERPTSPLPTNSTDPLSRVLSYTGAEARFFDLHGAVADDRADGGRTTLTAYLGGDRTRLTADRFVQASTAGGPLRPTLTAVETRNRWGSGAAGLADRRPLGVRAMLHSSLGVSLYHARFEKDDFVYRTTRNPLSAADLRPDTLGYDADLREGVAGQRLDVAAGTGMATVGAEAHVYWSVYEEQATIRPLFARRQLATRADAHAGWAGPLVPGLFLDAGVRGHWLSAGRYTRLAPRLRARLDLAPTLSAHAALGRSVQFVHRLTLGEVPAAAAWVLPAPDEPPTEADQIEVGVDLRPAPGTAVSLTAYAKDTRNQREHAGSLAARQLSDPSVLELPWLADVSARARGIEAMVQQRVGAWTATAVGATGRAQIEHPQLAGGRPLAAPGSRDHRLSLLADGPLGRGVSLAVAWTLASGLPNPLAPLRPAEPETLGAMRRLDVRLSARRQVGGAVVSGALAVRNATDARNAVDRDAVALVVTRSGQRQFVLDTLDIYDVGILASFDLRIAW